MSDQPTTKPTGGVSAGAYQVEPIEVRLTALDHAVRLHSSGVAPATTQDVLTSAYAFEDYLGGTR